MASASRAVQGKEIVAMEQNAEVHPDTLNDFSDDFELVSNSHVLESAENHELRSDIHVIDPIEAFELIQGEHRLLRNELSSQTELLRERVASMEEERQQKNQELETLKTELDSTKLDLSVKQIQEVELEKELKYFRECSEKTDALTAKLLQAEDEIKTQNRMINQFHSDGFVNVQPPMLTDHLLARELSQKEEYIDRLKKDLSGIESTFLAGQEHNDELTKANSELRGLVTALQSQAEIDKAEWNAARQDLEESIKYLCERLQACDSSFDPSSLKADRQPTTHTLRHRGSLNQPTVQQQPPTQTSPIIVRCALCQYPTGSVNNHSCPPAILDDLF